MNNDFVIKIGADLSDVIREVARYNGIIQKTQQNSLPSTEKSRLNALHSERIRLINAVGAADRSMLTAGEQKSTAVANKRYHDQERIYHITKELSQLSITSNEKEAATLRAISAQADKNVVAEAAHADRIKKTNAQLGIMAKTMMAIGTAYAMRMVRDMWRDAISYAKEYGEAMNEIRIVTGYSEEQANTLGERYRGLAEEMGVSSREIAKMGATLYRQGLGSDSAVEGRMKAVITYSKIAGEDVAQSADIIAVAVNSFGKSGESAADAAMRVVDVWTYMGDAVETEAGEIGTAMQKVVANAKVVGLSLEKTSSFIATISSATRETPEVVGTALNRIISRYEKLTATGMNKIFTSEDGEAVAVNDVAKALDTVGISLYTAGLGFESFGDILDQLGGKWDTLGEAEQRHIAFQMAGVHGINKFYALMENYGRSLELYEGAMDAAGTANAKYAIYLEGVQAAQDNLKNSLEGLYAVFLSSGALKDFYNNIGGLVDTFKAGVSVVGTSTLKYIAFGVALAGIVAVIGKIVVAWKGAEKALIGGRIVGLLTGSPIRATLAVLGAISALIIGIVGAISQAAPKIKTFEEQLEDANNKLTKFTTRRDTMRDFAKQFEDLAKKQQTGVDVTDEYNTTMDTFAASTIGWGLQLKDQQGEWKSLAETIAMARGEVDTYSASMRAAEFEKMNIEVGPQLVELQKAQMRVSALDNVSGLSASGMSNKWLDSGTGDEGFNLGDDEIAARLKYFEDLAELMEYEGDYLATNEYAHQNGYIGLMPDFRKSAKKWLEDLNPASLKQIIESEYKMANGVVSETISGLLTSEFLNIDDLMKNPELFGMAGDFIMETFFGNISDFGGDEAKAKEWFDGTMANIGTFFTNVLDGNSADMSKYYGWGSQRILDTLFPPSGLDVRSTLNKLKLDTFGLTDEFMKAYTNVMELGIKGDFETPAEFVSSWFTLDDSQMRAAIRKYSNYIEVVKNSFSDLVESQSAQVDQTKVDSILSTPESLQALADGVALVKAGSISFDQLNSVLSSSTGPEDFAGKIAQMTANIMSDTKKAEDSIATFVAKSGELYGEFSKEQYKKHEAPADAKKLYDLMTGLYNISSEYQGDGDVRQTQGYKDKLKEIDDAVAAMNPIALIVLGEMYPKLIAAYGAAVSEAENAIATGYHAMAEAQGAFNQEGLDEELKKIQEYQDAISKVTTEMSTLESLVGLRAKVGTKEGVNADDLMPYMMSFPELFGGIGQSAEVQNTLFKAAIDKQKELVAQMIAETVKDIPGLQETLGLADDAVADYGIKTANTFVNAIVSTLNKGTPEENPFLEYLKAAMASINSDAVDKIFEETGMSGEIGRLQEYLRGYKTDDNTDAKTSFLQEIQRMSEAGEGTMDAVIFGKLKSLDDFDEIVYDMQYNGLNAADAIERLNKIIAKGISDKEAEKYKDIVDAMADMKKGGKEAAKGYETLVKKSKDLAKAQDALNAARNDSNKESDEYKENIKTVADYLGISVEQAEDYAMSQRRIADEAAYAGAGLSYLLNSLAATSGMSIDTSNIGSSLDAIGAAAGWNQTQVDALKAALAALNNATISTVTGADGKVTYKVNVPGASSYLGGSSPTGKKPSGGGGGGGGGDTGVSKELQKFFDTLKRKEEIGDITLELISLRKEYFELRGEITMAMKVTEEEIAQAKKLADEDMAAAASIKAKMEAKQAEIKGLKVGSKAYKQAEADLEELVNQHNEYSKKILDNRNNLEQLTQSIKAYRDQIRDMEIELREVLKEAYEANQEREQEAVESRVEIEDEILRVTQDRYQEEWDLIKEDVDRKRNAYSEEMKLLRDKLAERKKTAEEEDKLKQLEDLERQLSMIALDPTRAKEQEELMKKITALREDLSWQAAEKEVDLQEKSIEQQIESLDKYVEYIDKYYTDMFENPQKMIEAMNTNMQQANEDIRQWLTDNYLGFTSMTLEEQKRVIEDFHRVSQESDANLTKWMTENIISFSGWTAAQQAKVIGDIKKLATDADTTAVDFMKGNNDNLRIWLEANYKGFSELTAAEQSKVITEMANMAYKTEGELRAWMEKNIIGFAGANKATQDQMMLDVEKQVNTSIGKIVTWLQNSDSEYAKSTAAKKQSMTSAWTETMSALLGITFFGWGIIEDIIMGGDDAIIKYLKDNHPDYKDAGKLQAEAFVGEWLAKLAELKAAYLEVEELMKPEPAEADTSSGGTGSGGGGGGGGGTVYSADYFDRVANDYKTITSTVSQADADKKASEAQVASYKNWWALNWGTSSSSNTSSSGLTLPTKPTATPFANGGLVNYTGPAMVHGSPLRPEAFLSADDTIAMRKFLDVFSPIMIPSMPRYNTGSAQEQSSFNIEGITIQVEKLDTDQDFEAMAEKVAKVLHRSLTIKSGAPVMARF